MVLLFDAPSLFSLDKLVGVETLGLGRNVVARQVKSASWRQVDFLYSPILELGTRKDSPLHTLSAAQLPVVHLHDTQWANLYDLASLCKFILSTWYRFFTIRFLILIEQVMFGNNEILVIWW